MWLAVHGGPSFDLLTMDTVGWGRAGTAVPQGAVSELPNLPFFSPASIPKAIAQPSVRRPLSGLPPSSPSSSQVAVYDRDIYRECVLSKITSSPRPSFR
jgi:hypothetical protein